MDSTLLSSSEIIKFPHLGTELAFKHSNRTNTETELAFKHSNIQTELAFKPSNLQTELTFKHSTFYVST